MTNRIPATRENIRKAKEAQEQTQKQAPQESTRLAKALAALKSLPR